MSAEVKHPLNIEELGKILVDLQQDLPAMLQGIQVQEEKHPPKKSPSIPPAEFQIDKYRNEINNLCYFVLGVLMQERSAQDRGTCDADEATILVYEAAKDGLLHRNNTRETGESYFFEHLVGVAVILITELGITEQDAILGAFKHDNLEDIEHLKGLTENQIFELFCKEMYEKKLGATTRNRLNKTLKLTGRWVEGVSKEKATTNQETTIKTFKKLIEVLLKYKTVMPAYIKLADRLHNMRTIDGIINSKSPKKGLARAREIADETMKIYVPLARVFKLHHVEAELVERATRILNPEFYKRYEQEVAKSMGPYCRLPGNRMSPAEKELREKFQGLDDIIERIEIKPVPLSRLLNENKISDVRGKNIRDLTTLKTAEGTRDEFPARPLFDIVIITKQNEQEPGSTNKWRSLNKLLGKIIEEFSPPVDRGYDITPLSNSRGKMITILDPESGMLLNFRINEKSAEHNQNKGAMMPQGRMSEKKHPGSTMDEQPRMPKMIEEGLERVIWRIEDLEKNAQPGEEIDIFQFTDASVLRQLITTYTPRGELVQLPEGAIALDFAYAVHPEVLFRTCGVEVGTRLDGRGKKPWPLLRPLPADHYVWITTTHNTSAVQTDWIIACETGAGERLGKHIRSKEFIKDAEERNEVLMALGMEHVENFCNLFGLAPEGILQTIRGQRPYSPRYSDEALYRLIGSGTINVYRLAAEKFFESETTWRIEVTLSHKEGVLLGDFAQNFRSNLMNIEHLETRDIPGEKEEKKIVFRGNLVQEKDAVYSFMIEIMKLASQGYKVHAHPIADDAPVSTAPGRR